MAYAGGLGGLLAWVGMGRARIRRWILSAVPVTEARILLTFVQARKTAGICRDFLVLESDRVPASISCGLFHPVVLLPTGLAERLSDPELRALAVHELVHVKRRDPAVLLLVALVRSALFFHPLVWLAARQVSVLSEQVADDAVIDAMGEPVSYARMLTRLAERLPRRAVGTELAAGILFSKGAFLRRVEAILSDRRDHIRKLTRLALAGTLAGAVLAVGVALALPVAEKRESEIALAQKPAEEAGGQAAPAASDETAAAADAAAADALVGKWLQEGRTKKAYMLIERRIAGQVVVLQKESLGESIARLDEVAPYAWPGPGELPLLEVSLPIKKGAGSLEVDWIMSNRRFLKVYEEVRALPPAEAGAVLAKALDEALASYRGVFGAYMKHVERFTAPDHAFSERSTFPPFQVGNNPDRSPDLLGPRLKVLSLMLIAGNVHLKEAAPAVRAVVQEAVRQRDMFYDPKRFKEADGVGMVADASLYNREILATALLGTGMALLDADKAVVDVGAAWNAKDLTRYDVPATAYDLSARDDGAVDYSGGLRVQYIEPIDDGQFNAMMAKVTAAAK
jgi:beta-lactamase regulating signal transducer with metallopeptidase domain